MRLIKKKSTKTYQGEDKKEHPYYNYYLELDNGKRISVKPACKKGEEKQNYKVFDAVAVYEG